LPVARWCHHGYLQCQLSRRPMKEMETVITTCTKGWIEAAGGVGFHS
jgi:hypothetical protein